MIFILAELSTEWLLIYSWTFYWITFNLAELDDLSYLNFLLDDFILAEVSTEWLLS